VVCQLMRVLRSVVVGLSPGVAGTLHHLNSYFTPIKKCREGEGRGARTKGKEVVSTCLGALEGGSSQDKCGKNFLQV
jgi:hypothetical protein